MTDDWLAGLRAEQAAIAAQSRDEMAAAEHQLAQAMADAERNAEQIAARTVTMEDVKASTAHQPIGEDDLEDRIMVDDYDTTDAPAPAPPAPTPVPPRPVPTRRAARPARDDVDEDDSPVITRQDSW